MVSEVAFRSMRTLVSRLTEISSTKHLLNRSENKLNLFWNISRNEQQLLAFGPQCFPYLLWRDWNFIYVYADSIL
jgi:hypothetical protein